MCRTFTITTPAVPKVWVQIPQFTDGFYQSDNNAACGPSLKLSEKQSLAKT